MNWNAIIAICEIIGAVAIVITLLYLSVQVRQSNILSRAQTRRDMLAAGVQELYAILNNPDIWESFQKESLTREEKIHLNEWLIACMRQREFEWFQKQDGTLDEETFRSYWSIIGIVLGTKRTRAWWTENKPYFHPGFSKSVDDYLQKTPLTEFFDTIDKWD